MTIITAESIKHMNVDDVVSLIESSQYSLVDQIIDAMLELDMIITSFNDFKKILSCPIYYQNRIKIVRKHIEYCDSVENIIFLLNNFVSLQRVEFVKICKNKIKKIDDLQKILLNIDCKYQRFEVIKIFDFIGITYPDILKLVNLIGDEYYKRKTIKYFRNYIDVITTIKLINESGVESIYNIFHVDNFDESTNIITKLNNNVHKKQLITQYEELFDGQNIFKYLELLTNFSDQFEFIKYFYKKIVIENLFENPLELLKCVNGVTEQDDKNRQKLLEFIVKKMYVVLDTKCLNYFVTEQVRVELISDLVRSGTIKI